MKDFTSRLGKLDEVTRKHTEQLLDHDFRIAGQLNQIQERERIAETNGKKLEKCIVDIDNLSLTKTDQVQFEIYMENLNTKMSNAHEYIEISRNMVQGRKV